MRVSLTGMSGTGKSALVHELRRRGYAAYDADDDGFSEPRADGRWGWRADRVADLLLREAGRLVFFAGCSEEQIALPFDYRVLLTAPRSVLIERLRTRTGNSYGREGAELAQVRTHRRALGRVLLIVDDRDRFDLDQAAGMSQFLHPDQRVDGLVIA